MSHGGGAADPNLTPLLDLVLQLLMFFILCVNFSTEQVSNDIVLPYSDSAKPLEKSDLDNIYLNHKSMRAKKWRDDLQMKPDPSKQFTNLLERFEKYDSVVLVAGADLPKTLLETKRWLADQYESADKKVAKGGKVETVIHIRPDEDLELNEVFKLMQFCKTAGYKKLKIRAKIRRGEA